MAIDLDKRSMTWLVIALRDLEKRMKAVNAVSMPQHLAALVLACETHLVRDRVIGGHECSTLADLAKSIHADLVSPVRSVVGIDGAADVLSVSASSVRRLIDRGELASVEIGGRVLIRVADLDQYVRNLPIRKKAA